MVAVDVLVLEDRIGLVAVTEPCEILLGDGRQLRVAQTVVGMGIQGDMDDGLRRPHLLRQAACEVLRSLPDVEAARPLVEYSVGRQQPPLPLVYLLAVVRQSPVKGASYVNFGNHCC